MTNEEQMQEVEKWCTELRVIMEHGISKGRGGWQGESEVALLARFHEKFARFLREPTLIHAASATAYIFMFGDVHRECGQRRAEKVSKRPLTKAQLWRRVARLAGELALSDGARAVAFPWSVAVPGEQAVLELVNRVFNYDKIGGIDRLYRQKIIAKLEAALAAWEAAT